MSSESGGGSRRVSALNVDPKALRQRVIKAAEAVRDRCLGKFEVRGKRAQEDAQLLDRIKEESHRQDCASKVVEGWALMLQQCEPTGEQEERVIKAVLDARTHVKVLREFAADRKTEKESLLALREKVVAVHDHFRRQGVLYRKGELLRGFDRAGRLLGEEIKALEEEIRSVTRELKTCAGQRMLFMVELSKAMDGIFGKPLNAVVAALTDVALEWAGDPTTAEDVAQARWRDAKRRQNLYSEGKEGVE